MMTIDGQSPHSHQLTEQSRFMLNGKPAKLSDLEPGDRIRVTTNTQNVALQVEATREQNAARNAQSAQSRQDQRGQRDDEQPRLGNGDQPGQLSGYRLGILMGPSPTTGVFVQDVQPGSAADRAGIHPGDYILEVGEHQIDGDEALDKVMSEIKRDDKLDFTIWRNRQRQQLQVSFAARDNQDDHAQQFNGQQAWLGVQLGEVEDGSGVMVRRIYPSGPAARSGLRPGDMIMQVNGQAVAKPEDAAERIGSAEPNQQLQLTIQRGEARLEIAAVPRMRSEFFTSLDDESRTADESNDDRFEDFPEHAMMLEHQRHCAQQRQRIEELLHQVLGEVQELRAEIKTLKQQQQ